MQDQQIKEVESHKHLGVILFNDCSWQKHIDYIKEKVWTRINIMRQLKYDHDRKSLETIYKSFIRPLLEYADVIWDNCKQQNKSELELIQLEAARISTGITKLVLVANLHIETGWETLNARRISINWCSSTKCLTILPHFISHLLCLLLSRMHHVITYAIPMILRLLPLALLCFINLFYPHQFEIGTD